MKLLNLVVKVKLYTCLNNTFYWENTLEYSK